MPGGIYPILGALIGSSGPKPNPNFSINKYNPEDPSTYPYLKPSLGQKMFHPEVASFIHSKNLDPYNLDIDTAAKLRTGGKVRQSIAPFVGKSFQDVVTASPDSSAVLYPDPSMTGILSGEEAALDYSAGMPKARIDLENLTNQERTRKIKAALGAKLPELGARRDVLATKSDIDTLTADRPNIGPRAQLAGKQIEADATLLGPRTKVIRRGLARDIANADTLDEIAEEKAKNELAATVLDNARLSGIDPALEGRIASDAQRARGVVAKYPPVESEWVIDSNTGKVIRLPGMPSKLDMVYQEYGMKPPGSDNAIQLGNGLNFVPDRSTVATPTIKKETKPKLTEPIAYNDFINMVSKPTYSFWSGSRTADSNKAVAFRMLLEELANETETPVNAKDLHSALIKGEHNGIKGADVEAAWEALSPETKLRIYNKILDTLNINPTTIRQPIAE